MGWSDAGLEPVGVPPQTTAEFPREFSISIVQLQRFLEPLRRLHKERPRVCALRRRYLHISVCGQ